MIRREAHISEQERSNFSMANRLTIRCQEREYVLPEGLASECKNMESGEGCVESDASTEVVEELIKKQDITQLRGWVDTVSTMDELVDLFLLADKLGMDVEYFESRIALTLQGKNCTQLRALCKLPDDINQKEMAQVALHIKKTF